jgi:UDP-N-acetylglucosamine 3-dehydrogenase
MASQTQSANLRWGVIGLGWFGEIHADTLVGMPGIELAAFCTRRRERLDELADRYDVAGRYTDYRQLLADPSIDAVGITTHIDDHRDLAVAALRAGKHVFLEKPMAPTVEDCDQIIAATRESDGQFMVGHICRFDPRVALAKQAIDEGRLGRIISMHARRNLSRAIGEANLDKISALMGDGIHDADLMLWFTGAAAVSVYAQEVHPGPCKYPDAAWAMVRFDSGAVGVVESVWHLPNSTPFAIDARMEIIGTEGALYVNCGQAGLEIHGSEGISMPDTMYWPSVFGERFGVLRSELRYFANCIAQRKTPELITPQQSRDVVELITAAAESSRTDEVVRLG